MSGVLSAAVFIWAGKKAGLTIFELVLMTPIVTIIGGLMPMFFIAALVGLM